MPMPCSICHSERRDEIDQTIAAGQPVRAIAALFDIADSAVRRHRQNHAGDAVTTSSR